MQPIVSPHTEPKGDGGAAPAPPLCPVCTGVLIELRGFVRCTRCHFSMCAGCDGAGVEWPSPPVG